jgi:RNA polymerase sigma factor (sigma-70 family)
MALGMEDRWPAASNATLLTAASAGQHRAWEELMSRYSDLVRGTVRSYRLQEADAADAAQNTWLRLLERVHTIEQPERLGGWLATTASRECLALLRRRREIPDEATVRDAIADPDGAQSHAGRPDSALLYEEARTMLSAVVGELAPDRQLLIAALFYRVDRDYAGVAEVTGMPRGSIGPTRARVLRDLRLKLEDRGYGPDTAA